MRISAEHVCDKKECRILYVGDGSGVHVRNRKEKLEKERFNYVEGRRWGGRANSA